MLFLHCVYVCRVQCLIKQSEKRHTLVRLRDDNGGLQGISVRFTFLTAEEVHNRLTKQENTGPETVMALNGGVVQVKSPGWASHTVTFSKSSVPDCTQHHHYHTYHTEKMCFVKKSK